MAPPGPVVTVLAPPVDADLAPPDSPAIFIMDLLLTRLDTTDSAPVRVFLTCSPASRSTEPFLPLLAGEGEAALLLRDSLLEEAHQ